MSRILDLPRDERAPDTARQAVDELDGRLEPALVSVTRLLVSELVTNSVRHGEGSRVRLVLETSGAGRLRCEVRDHGPGFVPVPRERAATEPGGWGLVLVDRLVDRWGVREGGSSDVWFELSGS